MTQWRNCSGSVVADLAHVARPRDEAELARVVRAPRQLRVIGGGHSFMPLCATADTLVSLEDMAGDIVVAPDRRSVDALAGWSLKSGHRRLLWEQRPSLVNQGDLNPQSLGGALATGTHGTGRELGSFGTLAQSFRLVTADSRIVDCDCAAKPELFEAQRLSLGPSAARPAALSHWKSAEAFRLLSKHSAAGSLSRSPFSRTSDNVLYQLFGPVSGLFALQSGLSTSASLPIPLLG